MPNLDRGLEIFTNVADEEDCAVSGVVERLNDLNKSFLYAEASHNVPQAFMPHSVEGFLEVYEVVIEFFFVLQMFSIMI